MNTKKKKAEEPELVHRRCACGHTFFDLPKVPKEQYFSPMFKCKYCLAEDSLPVCKDCYECKVEPPRTICPACAKARLEFEQEQLEIKREREDKEREDRENYDY